MPRAKLSYSSRMRRRSKSEGPAVAQRACGKLAHSPHQGVVRGHHPDAVERDAARGETFTGISPHTIPSSRLLTCPTVSSGIVPKSHARARGKGSDWSSVGPHVAKSAEWWRGGKPKPQPLSLRRGSCLKSAAALPAPYCEECWPRVAGTKLHPRLQAPPGLRDPGARRSAPPTRRAPWSRSCSRDAEATGVTPHVRAHERRRCSLATPAG